MSQLIKPDPAASRNTCKVVYLLYLAGLVFGITLLIGVVMAYINRKDSPGWLQSHYRFQIRTFWIGCLWAFLGALFTPVLFGLLILLFWTVWLIVRCVKGIRYLDRGEPHPEPAGWWF